MHIQENGNKVFKGRKIKIGGVSWHGIQFWKKDNKMFLVECFKVVILLERCIERGISELKGYFDQDTTGSTYAFENCFWVNNLENSGEFSSSN